MTKQLENLKKARCRFLVALFVFGVVLSINIAVRVTGIKWGDIVVFFEGMKWLSY